MMRYVNSQLIIGLVGLGVAAFVVACGGGGGGGNVRPAPESGNQMTITPPGTIGCYSSNPDRPTIDVCVEFTGADCSTGNLPQGQLEVLGEIRQVQQCPRSSDAHRMIYECTLPGPIRTFSYLTTVFEDEALGVARSACEESVPGSSFTLHKPAAGGQPATSPPATSPPALPPAVAPTSPPQASGRDLPNIEIAGRGTTSGFAVRNSGGTAHVVTAGSWYEPKDGSYQRMMVTRTTSVPSGEVVQVPIACMQRSKRTPANGLRFFSSSKAVTGSVQSCQRTCLSGNAAEFQSCIWGCEAPSGSPPPGSAGSSSLSWSVVDACNDSRRVEYRFFEVANERNTGRSWPGGSRFYITPGYNRTVTSTLACSPGTSVAIGAQIDRDGGRWSFGAGFDGTRGCSECVYACGANTRTYRFGCPR